MLKKIIKGEHIKRQTKWYYVIGYWELRRLLYNVIIAICGILSILICAVTIPFFYFVIGVLLNIGYSFLWLIDLFIIKKYQIDYGKRIFWIYMVISLLFIFGLSFFMLFTILKNAT